jgi:potassium channel LctB
MKIKDNLKLQGKRIAKLVLIWILIGLLFSILYYLLPGELISAKSGEKITNLLDSIYFSFITILTIGYGDIYPTGFIRILTIIEGIVGWMLFGIIVYKIVSVKEDKILNEIHNLSNEQYLSRTRNYLFISNTNLVRFIKNCQSKKISINSRVYELEIISTTLSSNIDDAKRFLCRTKEIEKETNNEEITLLIKSINLGTSNFLESLNFLSKKSLQEKSPLKENIYKIIESEKKIIKYYNLEDKEIKDLREFINKLEKYKGKNGK